MKKIKCDFGLTIDQTDLEKTKEIAIISMVGGGKHFLANKIAKEIGNEITYINGREFRYETEGEILAMIELVLKEPNITFIIENVTFFHHNSDNFVIWIGRNCFEEITNYVLSEEQ